MERIVAQGILYDFYGSLLTKHQQETYEQVVYHDLSLQEIADAEGISRQAVSDLINRTTAQMERYEKSLGMIARFNEIRSSLEELKKAADQAEASPLRDAAQKAVREIGEELA